MNSMNFSPVPVWLDQLPFDPNDSSLRKIVIKAPDCRGGIETPANLTIEEKDGKFTLLAHCFTQTGDNEFGTSMSRHDCLGYFTEQGVALIGVHKHRGCSTKLEAIA